MMTKIKICGITNFPDARNAAYYGADAIGFNFYKGSKRYISPSEAESIGQRITKRVEKIGVFVDHALDEIINAKGIAKLDTIQLHGDESPKFIEDLRFKLDAIIIKAVRIGPEFDPNEVLKYKTDAILLDAHSESEFGGTGKIIDWTIAKRVAELVEKVYLAGGLNPDNVAEAIRFVRPYGVDVASGVESSPGKKNPEKVAAFIKAAKEAL